MTDDRIRRDIGAAVVGKGFNADMIRALRE
jgi:hypothetical protein